MLKTLLKILAIYCLIAIAVSGCALIGEYAEGITATPNGTAHTVPSAEGKAKGKSISESGKLKQTRVVFDTRAEGESKPIKVLNTTETERSKQDVKLCAKVNIMFKPLPSDLIESAFAELRKHRKFFVTKDIHRYIKWWNTQS